jgi:fluoride exporter
MEDGVNGIWPWLAVPVVGGLGALLRVVVDTEVQLQRPGRFPLGTLAVNASGSLALGLLTGLDVGGATLLVVGGGLIGAYTTFSTWMVETWELAEDDLWREAGLNLAVSLAAGLSCAAAGWALGSLF